MANMADVVVKKNDNTTDITYNALAGSSGEKVEAVWRVNSSSLPPAFKPQARMSARSSANSTRRTIETLVVFPITKDVGGTLSQVGVHSVRTIAVIDTADPQSNIDEAISQGLNFAAATLPRTAMKEGVAPRG